MKRYLLLLLLALGCAHASPAPKTAAAPQVRVENTGPKIPKLSFLNSAAVFEPTVIEGQPTLCFDSYTSVRGPSPRTEEMVGPSRVVTESVPCYKRFPTLKVYDQCIRDPRDIDKNLWMQEHVFFYVPDEGQEACIRTKGTWIPAP